MSIKLLDGQLFLHVDNFDSMVDEMMGAYGGDMDDVICVLRANGFVCTKCYGHNAHWVIVPTSLGKIDEAMLDFFVHIARGGVKGDITVLYDEGLKERYRFESGKLFNSQEKTCWGEEMEFLLQEEMANACLRS